MRSFSLAPSATSIVSPTPTASPSFKRVRCPPDWRKHWPTKASTSPACGAAATGRVPATIRIGAAQRLERLHRSVEIVDEDAEMMDADIVEAAAELIDVLELEDGEVERAVAEIEAPGEALGVVRIAGAADFLEVEGPLVEFRRL